MQILPATACDIMDDSTITSERLRTDERLNIEAGLKYLAFLRRTFSGDLKLALLAYNRGPATVQKLLAQGIDPSNGYERKVMKNL
jgi:soluble lytic murein transglycosylase-like protein